MSATAYHRPKTVAEALELLAADEGARPLAGGASMVAMMNARLLTPSAVVSLRGIESLAGSGTDADGRLRIGAMTRHYQTAENAKLTGTLAVVRAAAGSIANPVVRNMGTMGGSISLADPAADYPPALVAAGATVEVTGRTGARLVDAKDFFVDWYATALEPGELVTAILLPPARPGVGLYHKLALVSGDFAIVSVAYSAGKDGRVSVAIGGCGPHPVASDEANGLLARGEVQKAGELLAAAADPVDDVRGSAEYRRLVIPRLLARVAREAAQKLKELR
jgi:carbon-monoxide dehydrogenase medium subunit